MKCVNCELYSKSHDILDSLVYALLSSMKPINRNSKNSDKWNAICECILAHNTLVTLPELDSKGFVDGTTEYRVIIQTHILPCLQYP